MTNVYPGPIIVFDAECVLCSANAQFILSRDKRRHFRLAAMQGATGSAIYRQHGIDPADPDTMVVAIGDTVLRDSDAIIAIYAGLGWPWRALAALQIVPRPLRDRLYRLVARNRYRLFGKRDSCWLPTADYRDRLV